MKGPSATVWKIGSTASGLGGRALCTLPSSRLFVDTAVRRWQALTGEAARHAASGCAFDELAAERAAERAAPAAAAEEACHGA